MFYVVWGVLLKKSKKFYILREMKDIKENYRNLIDKLIDESEDES